MSIRINMIVLMALLMVNVIHASMDDIGEESHGGHGLKEHGVGSKDHEGTDYGGHKGGVSSKGYDRGFSYGTGHDTSKSVSYGDEGYGGKGYGDKEYRGYGLGGLGYGGYGLGGFRYPFFFHR